MCGIAGYFGPGRAETFLAAMLPRLECRGYDSWGAATYHGGWRVRRELGPPSDALEEGLNLPGGAGVAHVRWATHGQANLANCHPVAGGPAGAEPNVMLVHNGTLDNHVELRRMLGPRGYRFLTDTDTECIAHLVDLLWCGDPERTTRRVQCVLGGSFAFAAMHKARPECIMAATNGPPLLFTRCGLLASEPSAFSGLADACFRLEPGSAVALRAGRVEAGQSFRVEAVPRVEQAPAGGRMAAEIASQPAVVRELAASPVALPPSERFVLFGCGSSCNAALLGRFFLERLAGAPCQVEYATELADGWAFDSPGTTYVALTQSGETRDVLVAMEALSGPAASGRVFVLTNNEHSSAARMGKVIPLTCGPELAVAATKTFTAQVVRLYQAACGLSPLSCVRREAQENVADLADSLEKALDNPRTWPTATTNLLFLGRGLLYPAAREAALKFKEVCYRHAEAMPAGELKHGPLALIEPGMLSVFLAAKTSPARLGRILSNVSEVLTRQGEALAVVQEGEPARAMKEAGAAVVEAPSTACPFLQPLVINTIVQSACLELARAEGKDADRPRNIAKCITV